MPTQEFGIIIITFWQSPQFASFEVFAVLIITIQDHNDNTKSQYAKRQLTKTTQHTSWNTGSIMKLMEEPFTC